MAKLNKVKPMRADAMTSVGWLIRLAFIIYVCVALVSFCGAEWWL